jgi:hypothetical protein
MSPQHWVQGISLATAAILLLPAFSQITSTTRARARDRREVLLSVEGTCNGASHAEGYTDSKGYFSIQLARKRASHSELTKRACLGGESERLAAFGHHVAHFRPFCR